MKFILKSLTFQLELFDYGLNECFCHGKDSITCKLDIKSVSARGPINWHSIPICERNPALGKGFRRKSPPDEARDWVDGDSQ